MSKKKELFGYLKRYTIVHVLVYLVVGIIFMNLMNYQESFMNDSSFSNFRPLDSPIVRAAVLFQVLRGLLIALILYPFRKVIISSKYGWFILFAVLYGLTCLGAINATPGSIEGMIYTEVSLKEHFVGMPEVIVQSLGIGILFWLWERKSEKLDKIDDENDSKRLNA